MAKKDIKKKNYLDKCFASALMKTLDNHAERYDKLGWQKQAKIIRIFKKHAARVLLGQL